MGTHMYICAYSKLYYVMYAFVSQRDRRTSLPFTRVPRVTLTTLSFLQQLCGPNSNGRRVLSTSYYRTYIAVHTSRKVQRVLDI